MHIGSGIDVLLGGKIFSRGHEDGLLLEPTLFFDQTLIIEKGRLKMLDDPEIKEIASRYGNPDEVLEEKRESTIW